MIDNSVCAIVVTYHPNREDVLANVSALRSQVEHLVIVDNGSFAEEIEALRSQPALHLVENGQNLGIASALNIGMRRAHDLGAAWLLLFDQDSRVTPGFVATMLQAFQSSPWGERLAILVPRYTDLRSGSPLPGDHLPGHGLETAMTSGTLMRSGTFQTYGAFADELFIDSVDCEYSLRLRRQGKILDECPEAVLLHSPGTPNAHQVGGKVVFKTSNYSPLRRYYQERNKIWLAKRYFRTFPGYCFKIFIVSGKDLIKIVLFESDKFRKIRFFLRGLLDGLRGRMGKLQP